jgi:hypothetical protein
MEPVSGPAMLCFGDRSATLMPRRDWTREELIVAFNLYCKIPFGQIHIRNPLIIELASLQSHQNEASKNGKGTASVVPPTASSVPGFSR